MCTQMADNGAAQPNVAIDTATDAIVAPTDAEEEAQAPSTPPSIDSADTDNTVQAITELATSDTTVATTNDATGVM